MNVILDYSVGNGGRALVSGHHLRRELNGAMREIHLIRFSAFESHVQQIVDVLRVHAVVYLRVDKGGVSASQLEPGRIQSEWL